MALLRSTVGPGIGVKASGGIRDCDTALRMLAGLGDLLRHVLEDSPADEVPVPT